MSVVSTVMISCEYVDQEQPELIRRLVSGTEKDCLRLWPLTSFGPEDGPWDQRDRHWGRHGHPPATLLGGAFNCLFWPEFVQKVLSLPWEQPEMVQVFLKEEHDERFSVFEIIGGKLVCVLDRRFQVHDYDGDIP